MATRHGRIFWTVVVTIWMAICWVHGFNAGRLQELKRHLKFQSECLERDRALCDQIRALMRTIEINRIGQPPLPQEEFDGA
jgi:hypothetical protein